MDFSIVILENQVHSSKSMLEKRNRLLAKKHTQDIWHIYKEIRLDYVPSFFSRGAPPHPTIFPCGMGYNWIEDLFL